MVKVRRRGGAIAREQAALLRGGQGQDGSDLHHLARYRRDVDGFSATRAWARALASMVVVVVVNTQTLARVIAPTD